MRSSRLQCCSRRTLMDRLVSFSWSSGTILCYLMHSGCTLSFTNGRFPNGSMSCMYNALARLTQHWVLARLSFLLVLHWYETNINLNLREWTLTTEFLSWMKMRINDYELNKCLLTGETQSNDSRISRRIKIPRKYAWILCKLIGDHCDYVRYSHYENR